jgi:hypothetical protein
MKPFGWKHVHRRYPAVKVGDKSGCWRVTAFLGRGFQGRADMRVEMVCECGRRTEVFEFMARDRSKTCPHAKSKKARRP